MHLEVSSLPLELLEAILLRLPFAAILQAKQVCREWKWAIESRSFTGSYSSTAKLVTTFPGEGLTVDLIDSDSNVLRFQRADIFLGSFTCSKTGLMTAQDRHPGRCYVCNIFSNKWEEVPGLPDWAFGAVVFGLDDGRYKLVCWCRDGCIHSLESGQQVWTNHWVSKTEPRCWTSLVVIGNSLFRVDLAGRRLMEYDTLGEGKFSMKDITSREELDLMNMERMLMAWEGRLYLLLEYDGRLELWTISTSDGAAALVMKLNEFDELEGPVDVILNASIEDGSLVIVYSGFDAEDACTFTCNMTTKAFESFRRGGSSYISETVLVKL